jgi:hypothetical protein
MMDDSQRYKESLEQGFRDYGDRKQSSKQFSADMFDSEHGLGRLPVFKTEFADRNILTKPDATEEEEKRLLSVIPDRKRHKWFRSMSSSQALALSFFGNLVVHGQLDWLRDLKDDDGNAVFGTADLSAYNFSMEHEIGMLNEPRPTSLDAFISGRYRVAIECKLSETEFGPCSRPRLSKESPEYCDGSYTVQGGRKARCALTEIRVRYWDYVPKLFKWSADEDYAECPLRDNYQLVRNVLAACVREDGVASPNNGHAVVVYDKRNPAFAEGGKGAKAFQVTREALQDGQNLRKVSWQGICSFMKKNEKLGWLTKAIEEKYGILEG